MIGSSYPLPFRSQLEGALHSTHSEFRVTVALPTFSKWHWRTRAMDTDERRPSINHSAGQSFTTSLSQPHDTFFSKNTIKGVLYCIKIPLSFIQILLQDLSDWQDTQNTPSNNWSPPVNLFEKNNTFAPTTLSPSYKTSVSSTDYSEPCLPSVCLYIERRVCQCGVFGLWGGTHTPDGGCGYARTCYLLCGFS